MAELIGTRDGNTIITTVEDVENLRQQILFEEGAKLVATRVRTIMGAFADDRRMVAGVKLACQSPDLSVAEVIAFVSTHVPGPDAGYAAPGDHRISAGWNDAVTKHNRANRLLATPASGVRDQSDDAHDGLDGWGAAVARHNRGRQH